MRSSSAPRSERAPFASVGGGRRWIARRIRRCCLAGRAAGAAGGLLLCSAAAKCTRKLACSCPAPALQSYAGCRRVVPPRARAPSRCAFDRNATSAPAHSAHAPVRASRRRARAAVAAQRCERSLARDPARHGTRRCCAAAAACRGSARARCAARQHLRPQRCAVGQRSAAAYLGRSARAAPGRARAPPTHRRASAAWATRPRRTPAQQRGRWLFAAADALRTPLRGSPVSASWRFSWLL